MKQMLYAVTMNRFVHLPADSFSYFWERFGVCASHSLTDVYMLHNSICLHKDWFSIRNITFPTPPGFKGLAETRKAIEKRGLTRTPYRKGLTITELFVREILEHMVKESA